MGKSLTLSYAALGGNGKPQDVPTNFQVQRVDRPCQVVGIVEREAGGLPAAGAFGGAGLMIPLGMAKAINSPGPTTPSP